MQNNKKQDWKEKFDKKIKSYNKDGGFIVYVEDYDNQDFDVDLIKQFISETIDYVLAAEREKYIKLIEELKTDKRKVSVFRKGMNSWEAETYDEKMLVNAVLQVAIKRIKSLTK